MTHNDERVTIYNALNKAALDNGSLMNGMQVKRLQMQEIARRAGSNMRPARVGELMSKSGQKSPSLLEAARLAAGLYLSLEELPDRDTHLFPSERNSVAWRLSGVPQGTRPRACRIALGRLLEGQSQDEIREAIEAVYAAHDQRPLHLDESAVRDMIQGGLNMGLARFEPPPDAAEAVLEERDLASELAASLEHDPHALPLNGSKRRPVVRVVKNLAHASFALDPVAPHLVARIAHEIVAEHLRIHRTVYSIGLAGGMHCLTFVHTAGAESSPFPDDSGDKQITFVPLTLEPFSNQQLPIANSVVGQMVEQSRGLLGSRRVEGLTLQASRKVAGDQVSDGDDELMQRSYRQLHVAIFGCGDLESDGWLELAMRGVKTEGDVLPATDVCLNLLAEDGSSIPLQDGQFVGIGLADIRRLVQRDDRLALLLTSGRAKGRPIVVASRAGCVDTIVCDRAAAEAALEVLARGW